MVNVSDPDAATQLTELGPLGSTFDTDDGRLAAFYSYPENLERCWVRANMISSLDGGATDDGKAGGLAGPGDRALFSRMRQEADVILVGASTVRIENYSGAQMSLAERRERQGRGQTEVPPIAIVTHAADFEHDARIFTRTEVPPMIMTCRETVPEANARFGSTAEVIDVTRLKPGSRVVFGATVDLEDEDSGTTVTYQIVGDLEADIKQRLIAVSSPIARALIGKSAGDSFEFTAPNGVKHYEIIDVRYE